MKRDKFIVSYITEFGVRKICCELSEITEMSHRFKIVSIDFCEDTDSKNTTEE